jgi:glutathione S-transferase
MSIVLYHHPWSRAASVVWMLEEVGVPYELRFVDILAGEQSSEAHRALNPMGKIPVVVDGEATISEAAAIGVYLADRYAPGRLAPALDDPARGAFLRWAFFAPSVVEPGCMAHTSGWEFKPGSAGFGSYENLLATLSAGVTPGPWLLGERFTMADVILGSTLRWMLGFGMIEKRPEFVAYADRLGERPALKAADAKNAAIIAERNIGR